MQHSLTLVHPGQPCRRNNQTLVQQNTATVKAYHFILFFEPNDRSLIRLDN